MRALNLIPQFPYRKKQVIPFFDRYLKTKTRGLFGVASYTQLNWSWYNGLFMLYLEQQYFHKRNVKQIKLHSTNSRKELFVVAPKLVITKPATHKRGPMKPCSEHTLHSTINIACIQCRVTKLLDQHCSANHARLIIIRMTGVSIETTSLPKITQAVCKQDSAGTEKRTPFSP